VDRREGGEKRERRPGPAGGGDQIHYARIFYASGRGPKVCVKLTIVPRSHCGKRPLWGGEAWGEGNRRK